MLKKKPIVNYDGAEDNCRRMNPVLVENNRMTLRRRKMKKTVLIMAIIAVFVLTFVYIACDNDNGGVEVSTTSTVTFNSNGGTPVAQITVEKGSKITAPENPTKENCGFLGWHLEETLDTKWDFNNVVMESMTLYAKWGEKRLRSYEQSVQKILFTFDTATVTFEDLAYNDIYLVKVNNGDKEVYASETGGVKNFLSKAQNNINYINSSKQLLSVGAISPLPIIQKLPSTKSQSNAIPYIGDKKQETYIDLNVLGIYDVNSTLKAIGKYCYVWIGDYQKYTTLLKGETVEEFTPTVTYDQAREIANKFDFMYNTMTQLYNVDLFEGLNSEKIILEFYLSKGDWGGIYMGDRTLHIDSSLLSKPDNMVAVITHEFQHLINNKVNGNQQLWLDELIAYTAMDVFASPFGISSSFLPQSMIEEFNKTAHYSQQSFPETVGWVYIIGAYLLRNYGGVSLFRELVTNKKTGLDALDQALGKFQTGLTFKEAFSRFSEALIFEGGLKPIGVMSLDKSIASDFNGVSYKLNAINIWGSNSKPAVVYNLIPKDMHPYSLIIQSHDEWKNVSGKISITLEKPRNEDVELILMVK